VARSSELGESAKERAEKGKAQDQAQLDHLRAITNAEQKKELAEHNILASVAEKQKALQQKLAAWANSDDAVVRHTQDISKSPPIPLYDIPMKSKRDILTTLKPELAPVSENLSRNITLENVKIPNLKKKTNYPDGTTIESNDKRLHRLLSQITTFTEPGDEVTLKNVDLDFEGTRQMAELQEEHGNKAFSTALEVAGIIIAGGMTGVLSDLYTAPFSGPAMKAIEGKLKGIMGLFKFPSS